MVNMKCFPDEHFVSHMGNIKENKKVQMVNTKCLPDEHCVSHMDVTETWETSTDTVQSGAQLKLMFVKIS